MFLTNTGSRDVSRICCGAIVTRLSEGSPPIRDPRFTKLVLLSCTQKNILHRSNKQLLNPFKCYPQTINAHVQGSAIDFHVQVEVYLKVSIKKHCYDGLGLFKAPAGHIAKF